MDEPILGQISMFTGNFPPRGWAFCDGQLLPIAQNTALFSLLGTTYGGNGVNTFALPDLRVRTPMGNGTGPGLTPRQLGEQTGTASVTLTNAQIPAHTHVLSVFDSAATNVVPTDRQLARSGEFSAYQPSSGAQTVALGAQSLGITGGSQPHNNLPPFLAINFIIALQGIYPQRP